MPANSTSTPRSELRGHMALMAAQLCFGLFPLFGKWAFEAFSPSAVAGWRMLAGAAIFGVLAALVYGRAALPRGSDVLRLQALAFLGVVFNQVLYLEGLARTTATNAGLLMLLIPVFTYLIAVGVQQERFDVRRGIGITIALVGTAQLFLQRGPDLGASYMTGNLLIVANTFSFSLFLVLSRPLARRYPPLVVITWTYVLSVWTVPWFAAGADFAPAMADARAWGSLAFIVAFPTVLGYLLNIYSLAHVAASTTAVYIFVQPLIAGGAGVLLLGEELRGATLLAGVIIFSGLALVVLRRR